MLEREAALCSPLHSLSPHYPRWLQSCCSEESFYLWNTATIRKKATDLSRFFSFNVLFLLCFCRANELQPPGFTTFARLEFSGFSFFFFSFSSSSSLSFSFPSLLPPLPCAVLLRWEQVIAGSVGQCRSFSAFSPILLFSPRSLEVWNRVVTVSPAIRGEWAEAESPSHAHTRGALEGGVVFLMLGAALEEHVLS